MSFFKKFFTAPLKLTGAFPNLANDVWGDEFRTPWSDSAKSINDKKVKRKKKLDKVMGTLVSKSSPEYIKAKEEAELKEAKKISSKRNFKPKKTLSKNDINFIKTIDIY